MLAVLALLIGAILFLRARNAPTAENQLFQSISSGGTGSGVTPKPGGQTGTGTGTGKVKNNDNGYTPVPFEKLPQGTPYVVKPGEAVPSFADKNLPYASADGKLHENK